MSIGKKFTLLILSLIVLSMSFTSFFTYVQSSDVLYKKIESGMSELNSSLSQTIQSLLEKETAVVATISAQDDIISVLEFNGINGNPSESTSNLEKLNLRLENYVKAAGNSEHIFVINNKGIIVADSDGNLIGKDLSDREYVKDTLSKSKPVISKVLVSKSTGALVIAVTYPVIENGNTLGFVANAVRVDSFSKYLGSVKVAGTSSSYAYIVDSTGNMLYHPTKEKINKPVENASIKEIISKISKGEQVKSGIANYVFNGKAKVASYIEIPGCNWLLVLTGDIADIKLPVRNMLKLTMLSTVIIAFISVLIGLFMSNLFTKPIKKVTQILYKTANLDIADDPSYDYLLKYKDEVGLIMNAVAKTRQALREMIEKISQVSDSVNGQSGVMRQLVETLKEQTNETSAATEELSAGMEQSAASIQEINATSEEIEASINSISERASEGSTAAEEISRRAEQLKEDVLNSSNNAKSIYTKTKQELELAIKKSRTVSEIDVLAQAILNITSQTNLLALNAAIEAARAGEAGKGFAVVANEIRKLAEQSSRTAVDIQEVVKNVNSSVMNLSDSASKVMEFMDKDVISEFEKLIQTAEQYNSDAELFNDIVTEFSATSEQLNASITNVGNSIKEVSGAITEGAEGVENIAHKANSIVEETAVLSESSDKNFENAAQLKALISKFKI